MSAVQGIVGEPAGPAAGAGAAPATLGCWACGTLMDAPAPPGHGARVGCATCGTELERTTGRSLDGALACASACLLLLIPANLAPFLTTSVLGASRESRLISSATEMWGEGWPLLGATVGLFVVVLPFVRFGLLTLVLGSLRLGRRPAWLGWAFRLAGSLQPWAMPDVFLLGLWIAYARLAATIPTTLGVGAQCFIGAGLLALLTRASLDKAAVWRAIAPDRAAPAKAGEAGGEAVTCPHCRLVLPAECADAPCPRCRAKVHARRPNSVACAVALTLAGLIFYLPANLYPIATLPIGLTPTRYTVLEGVGDLVQAKLLGLAALVFTASFAIPMLKLLGISICIASVLRRSPDHLRAKTRLYGVIEEIGRWSMVDPFVIACFTPVTQYNALLHGRAEAAAPCFTAVVVLTILAAQQFDPRLMWDAARRRA